jgi:hypothetical protein
MSECTLSTHSWQPNQIVRNLSLLGVNFTTWSRGERGGMRDVSFMDCRAGRAMPCALGERGLIFLLHALHHQPEQFHSRGWRAFYWLKLCASGRLEWFQFKVVEILIAEPEQQGAVRRRCFNTKAPEISWFRQRAREQKMQRSGRTRRGGAAEIWPSRSRRIPRNYFSLREMKRIERNNYIKSRL